MRDGAQAVPDLPDCSASRIDPVLLGTRMPHAPSASRPGLCGGRAMRAALTPSALFAKVSTVRFAPAASDGRRPADSLSASSPPPAPSSCSSRSPLAVLDIFPNTRRLRSRVRRSQAVGARRCLIPSRAAGREHIRSGEFRGQKIKAVDRCIEISVLRNGCGHTSSGDRR
jgi:hypothetical protein